VGASGVGALSEAAFQARDTSALEKQLVETHPIGADLIENIEGHNETMRSNADDGALPETGIPDMQEYQQP